MSTKALKERARARRRQQQRRTYLIWGGFGTITLIVVGVLVWFAVRPAAGEKVAIMASASQHVNYDDLPQYSTNPPTSGAHIGQSLRAGFYQESDLAGMPPRPEGNLVHNLEHGYVIFWYNCQVLETAECENLKADIQVVMEDFNNVKLIAFPWHTIEEPLAMTSWGQLQRFETFDADMAAQFIRSNRNRSPEPEAP